MAFFFEEHKIPCWVTILSQGCVGHLSTIESSSSFCNPTDFVGTGGVDVDIDHESDVMESLEDNS